MLPVSVCLIVKNEEGCLEKCLDSVQPYVQEIIVVDTGSIDATKEIAQKYTTYIFTILHGLTKF